MNTGKTLYPSGIGRSLLGALALVVLAAFATPQVAQADTAAGTTLTNSVEVTYADSGGAAQTPVSDSVTVTVSLVGSVSWGAAPAGQNADSGATLPSAYPIDLVNIGNGSDTYTITDGTTQSSADLSAGSWTLSPDEDGATAGVQITLFGTISSGAGSFDGTNTTIPVGNLIVADLVDNTTVVRINGTDYTVASGHTATALVVQGDATTDAAGTGVQIGEVATLTYNGDPVGTLSNGTTSATHDHSLTATGLSQDGNAAATATVSGWSTTVNLGVLSVSKHVRNSSNANGNTNGTNPTTVNGQTYYDGGITGNPADILEYVVVMTNTGQGKTTNVVLTDTLPGYTTYQSSSVKVDTNGDGSYDHILGAGDSEADNEGGIVVVSGSTLTVYAGTGGDEDTDTGGEIAGGGTEKSITLYQVAIQ